MRRFEFVGGTGAVVLLFVGSLGLLVTAPALATHSDWVTALPINADDVRDTSQVHMALDASGAGFVMWIESEGAKGTLWAARILGGPGTYRAIPLAGSVQGLDLAINPNGDAIVVWGERRNNVRFDVFAIRFDAETQGWGTATLIEGADGWISGPHVAMDPGGNATAVWGREDGTPSNDHLSIWASQFTPGSGWGQPTLIETDDAESARLAHIAMDSQGRAIVVWRQWDGARSNIWANRFVPGEGWDTGLVIETDDGGSGISPRVAMDADGNAVVVWEMLRSNGQRFDRLDIMSNRFSAATSSWGTAVAVETEMVKTGNSQLQLAGDAAGNAVSVWREQIGSNLNIRASRFDAGSSSWGQSVPIEDRTGESYSPRIALDASGNTVALWGRSDNLWSKRFDVLAGGWGTARLVEAEAGDATQPQLALDSEGNAVAAWFQRRSALARSDVYLNRFTDQDSWGVPTVLRKGTAGDRLWLEFSTDAEGKGFVVWSQSDGTRYEIWANRHSTTTPPADLSWESRRLIGAGSGESRDLRLAMNPRGDAIVAWLQRDGSGSNVVANRYGPGGWGHASAIETSEGNASNLQLAMDSNGNAIAIWSHEFDVGPSILANRFDAISGSWGFPVAVPGGTDSDSPQIAMTPQGDAIAVWSRWDSLKSIIATNGFDARSETWGNSQVVSGIGGSGAGPQIAVNWKGNAIVAWSHSDGILSNRFVPGLGWGIPTSIATDGWDWDRIFFVSRVAMDTDGNAIAVGAVGYGFGFGRIWASRFDVDQAIWGKALFIDGEPRSYIGAPLLVIDAYGHAFAMWVKSVRSPGPEIQLSRFNVVTERWETPIAVDSGDVPSGSVAFALDPSANVIAVWWQWDSDRFRVFANRYATDTTPPTLSLTSPADGSIVDEPTVTVAGLTEPGTTLTINGVEATVAPDGSFSLRLALSEGENLIMAAATDHAGNSVTTSARVTYRIAVSPFEQELQDTRDTLDSTNTALAVAQSNILLLLLLQSAFVASIVVLFVLLWNYRRRGPGPGGNLPELNDSTVSGIARLKRKTIQRGDVRAKIPPGPSSDPPRRWPGRKAGSPVNLTTKERILVHLLNFPSALDAAEVPSELTQGGIAALATVDLRHFAQYVRPLVQEGLVLERTARVEGTLQRQKVYLLTERGSGRATGIQNRVLSALVSVRDGSGTQETSIASIFENVRGSHSILDIVREVIESGFVDLRS